MPLRTTEVASQCIWQPGSLPHTQTVKLSMDGREYSATVYDKETYWTAYLNYHGGNSEGAGTLPDEHTAKHWVAENIAFDLKISGGSQNDVQADSLLEQLQRDLDEVNKKIEAHNLTCERTNGFATNPAADIGGIRSRSAKRKAQLFDRWSRQAKEGVSLHQKRKLLQCQIAYIKNAPAREQADLRMLRAWDSLTVGETFQPGNNPLKIIRKNKLSIVTEGGISWSITEVIGLSRKRINELREKMDRASTVSSVGQPLPPGSAGSEQGE